MNRSSFFIFALLWINGGAWWANEKTTPTPKTTRSPRPTPRPYHWANEKTTPTPKTTRSPRPTPRPYNSCPCIQYVELYSSVTKDVWGKWEPRSTWTACSATDGGGWQWRRRKCDCGYNGYYDGTEEEKKEERKCNKIKDEFIYHSERQNWMDADNICKGEEAILVMEKSVVIRDYLKSDYGAGDMWVGVSDRDADDVYRFADGSRVNTTYWSKYFPSNCEKYGASCDCVSTNFDRKPGAWYNYRCNTKLPFLCQTINLEICLLYDKWKWPATNGGGCYSCLYRGFRFPETDCQIDKNCTDGLVCYTIAAYVNRVEAGSRVTIGHLGHLGSPWVVQSCAKPDALDFIRNNENTTCDVFKKVATMIDPDEGPKLEGLKFNRCTLHTCLHHATVCKKNKKNRFLLHQQKDDMDRKAPTSKRVADDCEVKITNAGMAGATDFGGDEHLPEYAFQRTNTRYWRGTSKYPQFIWFQFQTPHILAAIEVAPNRNAFGPKRFEVVGSNDCLNDTWERMLEVPNSGFPNNMKEGVSEYWAIPIPRRPYTCIGLKIFSIPHGTIDGPPEVKNIVMWEDLEEP